MGKVQQRQKFSSSTEHVPAIKESFELLTHQPDGQPSAEKAVGLISLPELVKEMPQKTPKRRDVIRLHNSRRR